MPGPHLGADRVSRRRRREKGPPLAYSTPQTNEIGARWTPTAPAAAGEAPPTGSAHGRRCTRSCSKTAFPGQRDDRNITNVATDLVSRFLHRGVGQLSTPKRALSLRGTNRS
jgi:hypothetical protein